MASKDKKSATGKSANKQTQQSRYPLKFILPAVITVVTFICFSFSIKSGFVHWDDQVYVYDNPVIKSFSAQNLKQMLFHVVTAGNYHPLTMLSLALNYHFSGLSPMGYHLTNILLHLIDTVIVFFLFLALFEALQKAGYGTFAKKEWLAGLGALWHGIHPMHVESVSWISERKDLLYALFYFLGIVVYLRYINTKQTKSYVLLIFLFLLSSLSKPSAVVFPLSLLAIDFLLKRPFSQKTILEKVPMFIISLLLGIYTYSLQSTQGAMSASFDTFSVFQRCLFTTYTFMMYIVKAVAPLHLSNLYPYPKPEASGMLPLIYNISPLLVLAIVGVLIWLAKKAGDSYRRIVAAGLLFYFFNVVLILKFVTVGGSIINDRYSYVAYTGLFLVAIFLINELLKKFERSRSLIIAVTGAYTLFLSLACYSRTTVWYSTQTLWEDMKHKFPLTIQDPYAELAEYYKNQGIDNPAYYDSALANYEVLKSVWHTKSAGVYCNMANVYALKGDFVHSLETYPLAIECQPSDTSIYLDRALTYISMGQPTLAIPDLNKTLSLDSNHVQALQNRAFVYYTTHNYQLSLPDYMRLVRLNPEKAGEYMYDISILYSSMNENNEAIEYATKSQQTGYTLPAGYLDKLRSLNASSPKSD